MFLSFPINVGKAIINRPPVRIFNHFYRWYGHHSQSWVVYCLIHMNNPSNPSIAGWVTQSPWLPPRAASFPRGGVVGQIAKPFGTPQNHRRPRSPSTHENEYINDTVNVPLIEGLGWSRYVRFEFRGVARLFKAHPWEPLPRLLQEDWKVFFFSLAGPQSSDHEPWRSRFKLESCHLANPQEFKNTPLHQRNDWM